MTGAERDRLAALERQVAELAAELERYRRDACTLRTLEEMSLERLRYPAGPRTMPERSRPRHLHVVRGAR